MSITAPHTFVNPQLQRIAASLLAVKAYEGDGQIIHDSYTKANYIKRRHCFLGRHPDFSSNPQLLPKVNRDVSQVFESQADELSVEQVRSRELVCEIEPLLPLPTSTNTETLDNFGGTGTKEWTADIGHPVFSSSPQLSPTIAVAEPVVHDSASPDDDRNGARGFGEPVLDELIQASNMGQISRLSSQTITAGPDADLLTQQTSTNTASQHSSGTFNCNSTVSWPSAMDPPQTAVNLPESSLIMQQIVSALGAPKGSLQPSDAPEQYRNRQQDYRPQLQVSAVKRRPLNTPVKKQNTGKKRAAEVDVEGANANASGEDQGTNRPAKRNRKSSKKSRENVTAGEDPVEFSKPVRRPVAKAPRAAPAAAAPVPQATIKIKPQAKAPASSVAASVSTAKATASGSQRPVLGGKSLPPPIAAVAAAAAASRRKSHPLCVDGTNLPRSRREAEESAVERKQLLLANLFLTKPRARHPDLGPEFFDVVNFTEDEKDPDGEPAVRCICGATNDNAGFAGDWIGCDNYECRVWQHVPCMGEAVPTSEKRENGRYLCQQCDPWAHRRLIQKLRKEHPIP